MAITAVITPTSPSLAYRPIKFQLDSDDATIVNLIIEVLISTDGGVSGTRVSATNVSPDLGTTDEFTFDIQAIVQKHISFQLKTLGASAVINDIDNVQVRIKAYEQVLTAGVLVTSYDPDDADNSNFDYLSGSFACFNWRESHLSLATFDQNDYALTTSSKKFLSESPLTKDIELEQDEFLGMGWGVSSGIIKNYLINILTYDSVNSLLNTDTLTVAEWNLATVSNLTDPYLDVPVGTANILAMGVSLTNVAKYTIKLVNDDGVKSELRTYNIFDSCSTDLRIHFINKFGKQDSITLKGNQTESIDYKSINYTKALSETYSTRDYGQAIIQNTVETSYTAYSKSIGRSVLDFANSMLITKIAWMEVGGEYYSIVIESGSKVVRNEDNTPIQFRLDFSLANVQKGHIG